jgi:hypothetical protein
VPSFSERGLALALVSFSITLPGTRGQLPIIHTAVPMSFKLVRSRAIMLSSVLVVGGVAAGCADNAPKPRGVGTTDTADGRDTLKAEPPRPPLSTVLSPSRDAQPATFGVLPNRDRRDSVALASMTKPDSVLDARWPVKMPEPLPGAILPYKRIVAFYGNPLEKKMGVLGEYPKNVMLAKLDTAVTWWAKADPSHPVQPALHLVVMVAQGAPGKNGLYRLQMRDSMINEIHSWAKAKHALFFIDLQVGQSTVEAEIPRFAQFLVNPDVHLAIDPEFAMKPSGKVPGTKIGTMDASDVNWAVRYLDSLAKANNLPPKILVVHRFTRKMVTNAKDIRFTPHVQVVMDMDGWGPPWLKFDSYHDYVKAEPVQFTGFKLFFHNDTKKGDPLLTPQEVLRLYPRPLYIQYQ